MMHHHIFRPWSHVLLIFLQSINYSCEMEIITPGVEPKYWFPAGHCNADLNKPLKMNFLHTPIKLSDDDLTKEYLTRHYITISKQYTLLALNSLGIKLRKQIATEEHEYSSAVSIDRAFKTLWQHDNLEASEVQQWFEFLAFAMHRSRSYRPKSMPNARTSIIAGMHSLQIKFGHKQDINLHIEAMKEAFDQIAPSEVHGDSDWGIPFTGDFGPYLEHRPHLEELTQGELFGQALANHQEKRIEAVRKMIEEFSQYNAYRRILALAIFNQLVQIKEEIGTAEDDMDVFVVSNQFTPYESKLIDKISDNWHVPEDVSASKKTYP